MQWVCSAFGIFFIPSPDILMFFAFPDRRSFFLLKKSEATGSFISRIGGKSLKFTAMSL